jgi:hypothetical protein
MAEWLLSPQERLLSSVSHLVVFVFYFLQWGETEFTWYVGQYLAYCTSSGLRRSARSSEETCHSVSFLTINPTLFDLRSNPGRHGGKPATNRVKYGTAQLWSTSSRSVEQVWTEIGVDIRVQKTAGYECTPLYPLWGRGWVYLVRV